MFDPFSFLIWAIALLTAITIHEASHAFMADYLGDPTAKLKGRLTLNPLAHLDPIGTLLLLLVHFGWGKPVPVDPYNFRNPRRDNAIVALAGPVSNLLLAVILSVILRVSLGFIPTTIYYLLSTVVVFCVSLAIFNLIPIAPLDGFSVVLGFLPVDLSRQWEELRSYGVIFLLLILFPFGGNSLIINFLSPLISKILTLLLPNIGGFI